MRCRVERVGEKTVNVRPAELPGGSECHDHDEFGRHTRGDRRSLASQLPRATQQAVPVQPRRRCLLVGDVRFAASPLSS